MREDAELERLLRQLQRKIGQNLLIQTEDGQVLASTFSAKESFLRDAAEESVSIQELPNGRKRFHWILLPGDICLRFVRKIWRKA